MDQAVELVESGRRLTCFKGKVISSACCLFTPLPRVAAPCPSKISTSHSFQIKRGISCLGAYMGVTRSHGGGRHSAPAGSIHAFASICSRLALPLIADMQASVVNRVGMHGWEARAHMFSTLYSVDHAQRFATPRISHGVFACVVMLTSPNSCLAV